MWMVSSCFPIHRGVNCTTLVGVMRTCVGSRRLPAPLNGALRGRVAGALLGVGDKARPLVDPDRLHGSGEHAGCLPEVIMGCRCRGAEGCTMEQAGVSTCDRGVPEPGEKCTADANIQFCGAGGKVFVTCKDGVYAVKQKCPGPAGCKEQGGGLVSCDPHGAFVVGDACHFLSFTCTADSKAQLACKDGLFVLERECPGPDRCTSLGCDSGYVDPASPDLCTKDKRACSIDKKSLLACKQTTKKTDDGEVVETKWAVEKPCKVGCTAKDGQLACE